MNKRQQARELGRKGFSVKEIADKLGISEKTATLYLHPPKEGISAYQKMYRQKRKQETLKNTVIVNLRHYGLPARWVDPALDLLEKGVGPSYTLRAGSDTEFCVKSVLTLMCRRHKLPTPKELAKETKKYPRGRTTAGRKFSYVGFSEKLNGVNTAQPTDYITRFFLEQPQYKEVLPKALVIAEKLSSQFKQGRNPRVMAGACIYLSAKGILLQREIVDYLGITEQSLRYTVRQIESLEC